MTKQHSHLMPVLAALLLALAGCAANRPPQPVPLAPPSQSVAEADAKLALVASERARAEAAFAASEQVCYTKFLVNRCLDAGREKRRAKLAGLRAIEIEAEHFKRKAAADQRDREIAESDRQFEAEQASMAAQARPPRQQAAQPAPKAPAPAAGRAAAHTARMKQREAEAQTGAAKRAANVEAFEKRKRASEQRQREIEEKKKAKASEGAAK
jgi:colicin import membrane protein